MIHCVSDAEKQCNLLVISDSELGIYLPDLNIPLMQVLTKTFIGHTNV